MSLTKQFTTVVTFRSSLSEPENIRFLRLRIDSDGAGRYLVLTDQNEDCDKPGADIYFDSPDDLKMLYEAALDLWEQGPIYLDDPNW